MATSLAWAGIGLAAAREAIAAAPTADKMIRAMLNLLAFAYLRIADGPSNCRAASLNEP
jgi:hypothetical protein